MKKFIKIFVIVILVAATVGISCWLFFSKLKKEPDVFASVNSFVYNEKQKDINSEIDKLMEISASRFGEFKATNKNLLDITKNLNSYLLSSDYSVNKNKLKNSLAELNTKQTSLIQTYGEFNQKIAANTAFNKEVGSYVVFEKFSEYFVSYAKFLNLFNDQVTNTIKEEKADVTFYVFQVYLDVVENDFSNFKTEENGANSLREKNSVSVMNQYFNLESGYINLNSTNNFGIKCNSFIENYLNCNQSLFAKNLAENIILVTNLESATTNEQLAVFYFKEMYNI